MNTLARIIFSCLRIFPLYFRLPAARFFLIAFFACAPKYRRETTRNYQRLTGRPGRGFWLRNAAALGKNLALMLEIGRPGDNKLLDRTVIQGENEIMKAYRQGRGVVVVSLHFGPWELLPQLFARRGYPVAIAAQAQRDQWFDRQFSRIRSSRPITVTNRVADMKRALRNGSLLGFLLDNTTKTRRPPADWAWPDFRILRTPFALARATRAPVVPMVIYNRGRTPVVEIGDGQPLAPGLFFKKTIFRHPQEWVFFGKQ